jgi:hypothetical protein
LLELKGLKQIKIRSHTFTFTFTFITTRSYVTSLVLIERRDSIFLLDQKDFMDEEKEERAIIGNPTRQQ